MYIDVKHEMLTLSGKFKKEKHSQPFWKCDLFLKDQCIVSKNMYFRKDWSKKYMNKSDKNYVNHLEKITFSDIIFKEIIVTLINALKVVWIMDAL